MLRYSNKRRLVVALAAFIFCQSHVHIQGSNTGTVFTQLHDVVDKNCPDAFELMTSTGVHKKMRCASLCLRDGRCKAFVINEMAGKCILLSLSTRLTASCTGETGTLHYGKLQAGCPSGYSWHEGTRMCYKVATSCGTWYFGRAQCKEEGGDLLVLPDPDFWRFFQAFLQSSFNAQCGGVWIGATDVAAEGSWVWLDGTPVDLTVIGWGQEEPSGGNNENCMDMPKFADYRMNDAPCDYSDKQFACRIAM